MKYVSPFLLSLALLAGCATVIEGQTQPITILTPGAESVDCYLYNEDMSYKVRAGDTNEIMKSPNDLTIECLAPGNRQRTIVVESQLEPATLLNAVNAVVPGAAYDHFSRGLYAYPETITIDFSAMVATPYPQPDYMRPELRRAYVGEVEDYSPATPMLPGDRYDVQRIIPKKSGPSLTDSPFGDRTQSSGGAVTPVPSE